MLAKDLMQGTVVTIGEDATIEQLCDLLQAAHVNGLPVLSADGDLVGIVSEEDILYGTMGLPQEAGAREVRVRDIMTSPAVCATEETEVEEVCRMMWGMRIHHIPIVREGRVTGVVSSLDLARAVMQGALRPS